MKKKGFTLIELLAVIIILGILMLIAIPSVTTYINNSRKSTYVETIQELLKGAAVKVNSGELDMYDTDTTYYIPASTIQLEGGKAKSPYGDLDDAYIVVTYDGESYEYYFTGKDEKGMGVDEITKGDNITKDSIKEVGTVDKTVALNGKSKVVVFDDDLNAGIPQNAGSNVSGEGSANVPSGGSGNNNENNNDNNENNNNNNENNGNDNNENNNNNNDENNNTNEKPCAIKENDGVTYPTGKNRCSVKVGDVISIGTESFYVFKRDGSDLYVLSKYNLNIGRKAYLHETGIQHPMARGWVYVKNGTSEAGYGAVGFVPAGQYPPYWNGNVGTGKTYSGNICYSSSSYSNCAYVFDSNSRSYNYVTNYETYLVGQGATTIEEVRLLKIEEAFDLGCYNNSGWSNCDYYAPKFIMETTYWLGSPSSSEKVYVIQTNGTIMGEWGTNVSDFGIRPVVVL